MLRLDCVWAYRFNRENMGQGGGFQRGSSCNGTSLVRVDGANTSSVVIGVEWRTKFIYPI